MSVPSLVCGDSSAETQICTHVSNLYKDQPL